MRKIGWCFCILGGCFCILCDRETRESGTVEFDSLGMEGTLNVPTRRIFRSPLILLHCSLFVFVHIIWLAIAGGGDAYAYDFECQSFLGIIAEESSSMLEAIAVV
jgi:hypothetical protein